MKNNLDATDILVYKDSITSSQPLQGREILKKLYIPNRFTHKGQNGKLLIIGGSSLFHGASLWALKTASRIVDMVFYASVLENRDIAKKIKSKIFDFILIPQTEIEAYIEEAEAVLIGPGMVRTTKIKKNSEKSKRINNLSEILKIKKEGELTGILTEFLLRKYPNKKWIIDAGAIQMLDPSLIPEKAVLTPHKQEFRGLLDRSNNSKLKTIIRGQTSEISSESVKEFAHKHKCYILCKGTRDIVSDGATVICLEGGNPGMTKGGTGDVLAGLIAGFSCKNDSFLSVLAGSYLNKFAGNRLYQKVNNMYNASDLCEEIPRAYKYLLTT